MDVRIGDEIVIQSHRTGDTERMGEVLEILHRGDAVHYRVRWDDGNETIFFPSSDAHIVRPRGARH